MATSVSIKDGATRLTGFLGLYRSTAGVLAMVVLVGMGERDGVRLALISNENPCFEMTSILTDTILRSIKNRFSPTGIDYTEDS